MTDIKKFQRQGVDDLEFVFSVRIPIKYKQFIKDNRLDKRTIVLSVLDELMTEVKG